MLLQGRTSLMNACSRGHVSVARVLLASGANASIQDTRVSSRSHVLPHPNTHAFFPCPNVMSNLTAHRRCLVIGHILNQPLPGPIAQPALGSDSLQSACSVFSVLLRVLIVLLSSCCNTATSCWSFLVTCSLTLCMVLHDVIY